MPLRDLRRLTRPRPGAGGTTPPVLAAVLREAIVTGVLQAGEELNQVLLARQFGVSRVPVREAIRLLEAEGLVVSPPHRRSVVSALTPEVLGELYEVRLRLEELLLGAAVPRLGPQDLAEADALVAAMGRVRDHRAWLRLNDRFHDTLYRAAGRPFVSALVRQLRQQVQRYVWLSGRALYRAAEANAEHRRILEACRAGDVSRARRELRRHLLATYRGLRQALRSAPSGRRRAGSPGRLGALAPDRP